jgi:hypothetical protein
MYICLTLRICPSFINRQRPLVPKGGEPLLLPPPVYSDKKRESSVVRLNIIIKNKLNKKNLPLIVIFINFFVLIKIKY